VKCPVIAERVGADAGSMVIAGAAGRKAMAGRIEENPRLGGNEDGRL